MAAELHLRLAPERLAAARTTLQGRIDAAELSERLAAALCVPDTTGTIDYRLAFSSTAQGGVAVDGMLRARLGARCQRCLERMELGLDVPVQLAIPASADAEPEPGREQVEAGARPSLADLIEEELLLALPIVPRHPEAGCVVVSGGRESESGQRRGPLGELAELLRRSRD